MTSIRYTLLVDGRGQHTGDFATATDLAADAVPRAARIAAVSVTETDLAKDIDSGYITIDLRARNPHIAVVARTAA
ncbi:Uncharacterised protein (plasmid) [Tsukamurella tyrosinosolvens]|uniref:Uncharacterized protein n=1 Tax=Tsukamurella tyrosinosolvens TaxID=57704 RepID=A0A1H4V679_TSUTY|nr:hypothetical protein [Tsukamurella tyrosinosolvens]KXO91039.1 hypothetical protein AXK58_21655 [Tsukamurella tyrosinosolvens]SEC76426.1 hypothetical protein SAMN04489793_3153 [Tsukamurella tyrosinosolvens]VEH90664.1 Uncharacterised protein [Tsukamurella tyrosinosolvens]